MSWWEVFCELFDERTIIETSAFAISSSLSALFCFLHRKYETKAQKVEDAPWFELNNQFVDVVREAPFASLPYVAINGKVSTTSAPLRSEVNKNMFGVSWRKTITEHKDVWGKYSHTWQNEEREVSSIAENIPFDIQGFIMDGPFVQVVDPMHSTWFEESVDVIHEDFVPSSATAMQSIVGYVSGERVKGYTHTEKMLRLGTKLCAIGEVVYKDGNLEIRPPASRFGEYIISSLTRAEIVSKIRSSSTTLKVMAILTGAASVTALYFIIRRIGKRKLQLAEERRAADELAEVRNQRTVQSAHLNRGENSEDGLCVVCLNNPRECVILDCGHICVCVDCLEALPTPKECPVCRSRVVRTVPLFRA